MDTLHLAINQSRGPHSQQENMSQQLGKPAGSLKSVGLSQRSFKSLKANDGPVPPTSSAKKGLGLSAVNLASTPISLFRRKLGNVSNTPMSHNKFPGGSSLQQPHKKPAPLKEEVFVKPQNLSDTPRPKKKADGQIKKDQTASLQQLEFKTPVVPLPTLFEERENYYPIPPATFAYESHPYATVGMFERDLTSLPFDILEEEDEDADEAQKENRDMTVDDWLAIL